MLWHTLTITDIKGFAECSGLQTLMGRGRVTIVESLNIVPFLARTSTLLAAAYSKIMSSFLFYYKSKTQELERNKVENHFPESAGPIAATGFFPIKNTLDKTCSLLNRPELGDELRVKVCDDVDHRMAVRTELWSLVLKDRWKDKGDQDASEISERFDGCLSNTEMNDPRFCFDLLWRSLEGTEADCFFKSILQHLLYVRRSTIIRKTISSCFEELISQLVSAETLRTVFSTSTPIKDGDWLPMEEQERERCRAKLQETIKLLEECASEEATLCRLYAQIWEAQLERGRSRLQRKFKAGAAALQAPVQLGLLYLRRLRDRLAAAPPGGCASANALPPAPPAAATPTCGGPPLRLRPPATTTWRRPATCASAARHLRRWSHHPPAPPPPPTALAVAQTTPPLAGLPLPAWASRRAPPRASRRPAALDRLPLALTSRQPLRARSQKQAGLSAG
uniref:Drf_FH3 domain-containing protein n=1 Tax=Macrostomum lignano TaxID=282301 RepID=A0A1I8F951_9PLAT